MNRNNIPFLLVLFVLVGVLPALQGQNSNRRNIIETLATPDSATNATVRIYQDKRIEQQLNNRRSGGTRQATVSGFRVQVFSSNVQRTAKTEAFRVEKQIREAFPELSVYVNYISPFWKVRAGDFKTQAQAQAFRSQLIEAFPQMRSEAYVVREQIFVNGSK